MLSSRLISGSGAGRGARGLRRRRRRALQGIGGTMERLRERRPGRGFRRTFLVHRRQLLVHVGLAGIELEDLLVDGDGADHEPLLRELVGHDAKLLHRLALAPGQHQGVGEAETDLRVPGILLEKGIEPVERRLVVAPLEARLDFEERILLFLAKGHRSPERSVSRATKESPRLRGPRFPILP